MVDHSTPASAEARGTTSEEERLALLGILRLRADNPGPLTLSGTNTWIISRDPAYVIDPGPALAAHTNRVAEALAERGGLAAIVLTHDHADHSGGAGALRERFQAPVAAAGSGADVHLGDGDRIGPMECLSTPGHAPDHLALIAGGACFTGDAVLGEGSVFIAPDPGALDGYLAALERLRLRRLEVLCPGHGPPVWDAAAKLDGYIAHRLERERLLEQALARGLRTVEELLDAAWSDVPHNLRPAAAVTLAAHLDRLAEHGRLPDGVQRP